MGGLHGLDPYTHFPAEAASDPSFRFIGWPFQHSPYGPLFTLASYATAPLGLAGALWTFKAVTALASLGAVWLTARAAERLGGSARFATVFLGLNPVLLVLAVGGAHNDTLLIFALSLALLLSAGVAARPRAGALALAGGVGVKLTAGLGRRARRRRVRDHRGGDCRDRLRPRPRTARRAGGDHRRRRARLPDGDRGAAAARCDPQRAGGERAAVRSQRHPRLVAGSVGGGLPGGAGGHPLAHRAGRRLARCGGVGDDRPAPLHGLAAAVVCDLAAAPSGRLPRSAPAWRRAPALRLRRPDPPPAGRPPAQPCPGARRPAAARGRLARAARSR